LTLNRDLSKEQVSMLYICAGLPCIGKTTLSHTLARRVLAVRLRCDIITGVFIASYAIMKKA